VHFIRNALAHANKAQRQAVLAMIKTIFAQETPDAARAHGGLWPTSCARSFRSWPA
jgi:transposase-like protein